MTLSIVRDSVAPLLRRLFHMFWRFSRPLTVGVRALVLDGDGRVFLVEHSYVGGWHLPGGGVEQGETLAGALARELREEGKIELSESPVLHAIYFNPHTSPRDHVARDGVRWLRQACPPTLRAQRANVLRRFSAAAALPRYGARRPITRTLLAALSLK